MAEYVDLETMDVVSHAFLQRKHATYKRGVFTGDELAVMNAAPLAGDGPGDVRTGKAVTSATGYVRERRPYNEQELAAQSERQAADAKMAGIDFNGVMVSATAKDQFGLGTIRQFVLDGNTVNFEFENGAVVQITPQNVAQLEAVWIPFRQSFFQ